MWIYPSSGCTRDWNIVACIINWFRSYQLVWVINQSTTSSSRANPNLFMWNRVTLERWCIVEFWQYRVMHHRLICNWIACRERKRCKMFNVYCNMLVTTEAFNFMRLAHTIFNSQRRQFANNNTCTQTCNAETLQILPNSHQLLPPTGSRVSININNSTMSLSYLNFKTKCFSLSFMTNKVITYFSRVLSHFLRWHVLYLTWNSTCIVALKYALNGTSDIENRLCSDILQRGPLIY